MLKEFKKLCTPAKIYFAIAVIASLIALFNGAKIVAVFFKLVFAFVWTFILGWLCKKGYTTISWVLVLLPYIIIALIMLKVNNTGGIRQLMKSLKLQGAYGQESMTSNNKKQK